MANTREVKNRLRGVRKTRQITSAMKMVATVKLRHAQMALTNGRPFAERMRALTANLLAGMDVSPGDSPFLARRPATQATPPRRENILLIVVGADRGLCGNMNINVFRDALKAIDDFSAPAGNNRKPGISLILVGRKARDFFHARQNEKVAYRIRETLLFDGANAGQLGRHCCELYRKGEFNRVEMFYNESSSALQHHPVRATLLPLDLAQMRRFAVKSAGCFIFEPPCADMLDDVISGYVASEMRRILMKAAVAEQAARMVMMDKATKNADDLITTMRLAMNKLRQLAITTELADITTGAEALG